MRQLAASTPEQRARVRVLFYGQSLCRQEWTALVETRLRAAFPHADLTVVNRAVGGFPTQMLIDSAEHDLYPFYPDLLILQVQGDHYKYAEIVARVRQRTTAEILIVNDIVTWLPSGEPEADREQLKGYEWSERYSYELLPEIAAKYGCELADVRTPWRRYLQEHRLPYTALLDHTRHMNAHGNFLLAELVFRYLRCRPAQAVGSESGVIRDYVVGREIAWRDGRLALEFEGNRVEAIAAPGSAGTAAARVLLDGGAPTSMPELYVFTRPNDVPGTDWPWNVWSMYRVSAEAPLIAETWTLRITETTEDNSEFAFEVAGAVTGPDGRGVNTRRFVSNSGRVVIEPEHWHIKRAGDLVKRRMPAGTEIVWQAVPLGCDVCRPPRVQDASREAAITLAQGVRNGVHRLELIADGGRPPALKALRVYRPVSQ